MEPWAHRAVIFATAQFSCSIFSLHRQCLFSRTTRTLWILGFLGSACKNFACKWQNDAIYSRKLGKHVGLGLGQWGMSHGCYKVRSKRSETLPMLNMRFLPVYC